MNFSYWICPERPTPSRSPFLLGVPANLTEILLLKPPRASSDPSHATRNPATIVHITPTKVDHHLCFNPIYTPWCTGSIPTYCNCSPDLYSLDLDNAGYQVQGRPDRSTVCWDSTGASYSNFTCNGSLHHAFHSSSPFITFCNDTNPCSYNSTAQAQLLANGTHFAQHRPKQTYPGSYPGCTKFSQQSVPIRLLSQTILFPSYASFQGMCS